MDHEEVRKRVKEYFHNACSRLNRARYTQESAYVDALIGRLDGVLDLGDEDGSIEFSPTIVADRGPGCAENLYGADFAIEFQSENVDEPIHKAILSQAKNGCVDKMPKAEVIRLGKQCEKMARFTNSYIVLEAPDDDGVMPTVRIGTPKSNSWGEIRVGLDDYFLDLVLSCEHGDRRPSFLKGVASSNLKGLTIDVNGLEYTPTPKPRKKKNKNRGNSIE